ncbi:hypothetical protein Ciccas_005326 [Cichlidogyrus casuarinus]|uniref:Uncharacterized protein n=1 Tax=Cichlidogyrus casuarinus TaxID=1844966 RepID=A0ABD2Q8Y8_9PLAT
MNGGEGGYNKSGAHGAIGNPNGDCFFMFLDDFKGQGQGQSNPFSNGEGSNNQMGSPGAIGNPNGQGQGQSNPFLNGEEGSNKQTGAPNGNTSGDSYNNL